MVISLINRKGCELMKQNKKSIAYTLGGLFQ